MINESLIAETYKNKQKMGNWACFKPFNYKEIEAIRKIKESLSFNNGTISTSDNKLGINEDYRTTKVSWIYQQPEYKWLYEKVMFKMVEANSHMWNLDVFGYYEAFQYAIYTQGSHYDWHRDNNSFEVFMSEKYPGQILNASATTDIVSATSKFLIGERLAFQYEFEYSNDTSFSGTDENGKTLSFQQEGLKVYRVDADTGISILLKSPQQYTISNFSNYRYTTLTYVETNPVLKTGDKLLINDSIKANVIKVEPTFKRIVTVGQELVGGQRITGSVSGKTFTIVDAINHRDGIRHYKSEAGHYRNTFTSGDTSESHFKHETDKNEEKRKIKVIRPEFIKRVVNEFERIMLS